MGAPILHPIGEEPAEAVIEPGGEPLESGDYSVCSVHVRGLVHDH
jgi:hypothetical protein